jgi:hypothetical protein
MNRTVEAAEITKLVGRTSTKSRIFIPTEASAGSAMAAGAASSMVIVNTAQIRILIKISSLAVLSASESRGQLFS